MYLPSSRDPIGKGKDGFVIGTVVEIEVEGIRLLGIDLYVGGEVFVGYRTEPYVVVIVLDCNQSSSCTGSWQIDIIILYKRNGKERSYY